MILFIILIIAAIILLIVLYITSKNLDLIDKLNDEISNITVNTSSDDYIIHSKCDGICNGDLICDLSSRRCKNPLGSPCSTNVDCVTGLQCIDWICSNNSSDFNTNSMSLSNNSSDFNTQIDDKNIPKSLVEKTVTWKETNEIFYI